MFPTQKVSLSSVKPSTDAGTIGSTFYFDFDMGDFVIKNGNAHKIDEIESLKMWIKKVLKTDGDKYEIYDNYGVNLIDILTSGKSSAYIQSEIERVIKTALLKHECILNVYNFEFTRDHRTLNVKFNIDTIYGTTSEVIHL